jgi:hypothetical protein
MNEKRRKGWEKKEEIPKIVNKKRRKAILKKKRRDIKNCG